MFDQSCKQLARSIKGSILVLGSIKAEIVEAEGYSRRENESDPYAPVLNMQPGEFFCPRHRAALLLLIACPDNGKQGGCVLIRKVKIDERVVSGPGRVCQALGIGDPMTKGKMTQRGAELVMRVTS